MKGAFKLSVVGARLYLREPAAVFFSLIFPALLLLIYGAIFGNDRARRRAARARPPSSRARGA